MPKQRIALLGGTFDPIHLGHLLLAVHSYEALNLDRVIFVPTRMPPHKDQPAGEPADRLQMVRLAVADDDRFLVCDCELTRDKPSYSIDTVRQFQALLGSDVHLFWLIGSDMAPDLPSWHRIGDLLDMVEMVVVGRAGETWPDFSALEPALTPQQIKRIKTRSLELPLIQISSSEIRQRVARKQSVRYFVPGPVEKYILEHKLYLK